MRMRYVATMNEGKSDDIMKLMKLSGKDKDECILAYDEAGGDVSDALNKLGKKPKEKKIFKEGDIVVRIASPDSSKLTPDCQEFLKTYKFFKIIHVNENHNIDIGYVTPDGKQFYFSPNKFELRDKPKETPKPEDPTQQVGYRPNPSNPYVKVVKRSLDYYNPWDDDDNR